MHVKTGVKILGSTSFWLWRTIYHFTEENKVDFNMGSEHGADSDPEGGKGCCQKVSDCCQSCKGDCQAFAICCKTLSTGGKVATSVFAVIVISKY